MKGLTLRPVLDVLRSPVWAAVALIAAATTLAFAVWLPNLGLITGVVTAGDLPVTAKLRFLLASLGALTTSYTTTQAALLVMIAVLSGLNLAVTARAIRTRSQQRTAAGTGMSLAGIFTGLVGAGCSACGTMVLSTLLGTGTTAALTRALPLGGLELPLAAVLLLTAALLATARQARRSGACQIRPAPTGDAAPAGTPTPGRQPTLPDRQQWPVPERTPEPP